MSRRVRQRGVALVLVMWVAVLLAVVASSFIVERRTETLVMRNSLSMARAEAIADAGVQRAVCEIYRTDNAPGCVEARRHRARTGASTAFR